MSILAIPDIHGRKDELDRVLQLADACAGPAARIVFLGDLVDRGPDSRGVIQTLIDGIEAGRDWIVLRGNHEQMFLDVLCDAGEGDAEGALRRWLGGNNGGLETLRSYGLNPSFDMLDRQALIKAVPPAHRRFLEDLPFHHETDEHIFVHAGIRPGVPLAEQSPEDMLWIREPFLSDPRDHGKLVVHGHTSLERPRHYGNRLNLDGGAGWGRPLGVALLEGREAWLLAPTGPVALRP